jgi:hypothetical protein
MRRCCVAGAPASARVGEREAARAESEALRGCGAEEDDVLPSGMAAAARVARATKRARADAARSWAACT